MAERRMFAKSIVLSDAFLDMSMSARCLYFALSMFADDDGFVDSPKGIIRQCGANTEDLSELAENKFIISFNSGVIVIREWKINNSIQKDRYKPTQHKKEFSMLKLDENNAYYYLECDCIQNVSKMDTQNKIVKDSVGENSIGEESKEYVSIGEGSTGKASLREGELQKRENIERENPDSDEQETQKLGTYKNVILTNDQLNEFKAKYPENYEQIIDRYSNIVRADPKATKNIYAKLNAYASDQNK